MELGFTSIPLQYLNQVLRSSGCREETMDAIIPDSSPDVERVISVNAVPLMRGKECRAGSVCISGGIRCSVLYAAEGESQPRSLDLYLPFSIRADHPLVTEDAQVVFRPWIRSVDARVVNSRKLTVRADLCTDLRAYEPRQEDVPVLEHCPDSLETLQDSFSLCLPAEVAERSFRLTEELQFPQNRPLAGSVICYEPRLELTEKRLAGNKTVFKGLVHLTVLYESLEQKLCTLNTELPFSQFCELKELYDEEEPEVILAVTGCEVERTARPDGDGLLITVHILAQSVVFVRKDLQICSDAYALGGELIPRWKTMEISSCLDRQNFTRTVRESWQGSVGDVVDARTYLEEPFVQMSDLGAELIVNGSVKVLHHDTAGQLQEGSIRISLREQLPVAQNVRCVPSALVIGEPSVLPTGGGMELRCTVHLDVESMADQSFRTLSGGTVREVASRGIDHAVIVRRSHSGERLWDIAKANGTTVDRLRRANCLDADVTEAGILLIPT